MSRDELTRLVRDAAPFAGWGDDPDAAVDLTSLDVILIVSQLFEKHGIAVPSSELKRENFRSLNTVWALCERVAKK